MISIRRNENALNTITGLDATLSLLGSGDGTEIIHQRLTRGAYWPLRPEDGWDGLECIYILSGRLFVLSSENPFVLEAGHCFSACPVTEYVVFFAECETEFLYITSRPVFHLCNSIVGQLQHLAVSVEQKDGYTADHCHRIMNLSMKVAQELKLTGKEYFDLQLGSFLHDVGKVRVPDAILNKPAKLSTDEWNMMKLHPIHSWDMLKEVGFPFLDTAALLTLEHHERFDGSGYPYGLKGDEIHIGAAIIGVVDSFDAITTDRVYRKSRSVEIAIAEIVHYRGTLYNPNVVDAFLKVIERESGSYRQSVPVGNPKGNE